MSMQSLILVFVGGGLGSMARFAIAKLLQQISIDFPWATLCANAVGCLIIGMLMGGFHSSGLLSEHRKLLLVTGFCGGLTTFSTFTYENYAFIKGGQLFHFFGYSILSFGLCLGFVLLGHFLIKLT